MKLKKWLLGAIAALFLSLLVAGAGLAAGVTWQAFVAVFCAACVTHFGAWLKEHPIDKIEFDTERFEKPKDGE